MEKSLSLNFNNKIICEINFGKRSQVKVQASTNRSKDESSTQNKSIDY